MRRRDNLTLTVFLGSSVATGVLWGHLFGELLRRGEGWLALALVLLAVNALIAFRAYWVRNGR